MANGKDKVKGVELSFTVSDAKEKRAIDIKYDDAVKKTNDVAAARNEGKKEKELRSLKKLASDAKNLYNASVADAYYKFLAETEGKNAVKKALTGLFVPSVKDFKIKTDSADRAYLEVKPMNDYQIDLARMCDIIGKDYFADALWFSKLRATAQALATAIHRKVNGQADYSYVSGMTEEEMSEILGFKETINCNSDKDMVKTLQFITDSILMCPGEDGKNTIVVKDENWEMLKVRFTSYGGVLKVAIGSPMWTCQLVQELIYGLLNNKGNTVV